MFDSFFNDLFNLDSLGFTRPVKDMQPYTIYPSKEGCTIVVNALGIDKKDLKVYVKKSILYIKGETKLDEINYTNSINTSLSIDPMLVIKDLSYTVKNGLAFIYIKTEDKNEADLTAKYIEE